MTALALVLLGVTAVAGLGLVLVGGRPVPQLRALVVTALLAGTAAAAWAAGEGSDAVVGTATVLAVLASVTGGGPVATGVLHAADPAAVGVGGGAQDPELLRGGAWIGVLERAAITGTLLAGWPEGLAVVLAVKGLGRFDELRTPAAAERFIVGTLASALWAAACAGVVVLLRG
ncbi:hypothetical protein JKP75_10880 [Blastococcus sp. TML/M2B]|uniref:hypothetical protein n=1 Tax=unclassified Blastococcus TaxID=2619396 RepID=UPI001909E6DF|nr:MULTISPECIES: hypothetical protein [unclassified Blastococcus]MBN1093017.1 hypothetical protein [Blastococcus sp. TML/M2B]MBN1096867.1 hypothetical protein [Blastococcus sp. TML/C7B]